VLKLLRETVEVSALLRCERRVSKRQSLSITQHVAFVAHLLPDGRGSRVIVGIIKDISYLPVKYLDWPMDVRGLPSTMRLAVTLDLSQNRPTAVGASHISKPAFSPGS